MDKKSFNRLLNQLLDKELELLRKRFRPYMRRSFLRNKVTIKVSRSNDDNCAGYYENTKENERQMKYTHKIFITENYMESYKCWLNWHMKRFGIFNLRQVIKHELIHAFVFEEWEEWGDIKNMHGDYSPIFLGCLYWCGGTSGHQYTYEFKRTDLGEKIQCCRKYDDLFLVLQKYIIDLERSVRYINKNIGPLKELDIMFNHRGAGIVKKYYVKNDLNVFVQGKKEHQSIELMTLGLGFLVTPKTLIDNYKRKFDNGAMAAVHKETVAYIVGSDSKREITVCSNI